jgi:hypothetical protein
MQLAGQPAPLGLLGAHGAARAVAALVLQPVEHLVERLGQLAHVLGRRPDVQARAGRERVDRVHDPDQALQRCERVPDEDEIGGQVTTRPASSTTSSRGCTGELMVAGPSASARQAASRTAELTSTTRRARDISDRITAPA